jgi:hypothetical protein
VLRVCDLNKKIWFLTSTWKSFFFLLHGTGEFRLNKRRGACKLSCI